MQALSDLHNVTSLYFIRVPVTSDDLDALHKLTALHELYLCETSVRDDGLAHLADLAELRSLHLWGKQDAPGLTDAGLALLPPLRRLESIHLHGRGFTSAGLSHLKSQPKLTSVYGLNTNIPDDKRKAFVAELRKTSPQYSLPM